MPLSADGADIRARGFANFGGEEEEKGERKDPFEQLRQQTSQKFGIDTKKAAPPPPRAEPLISFRPPQQSNNREVPFYNRMKRDERPEAFVVSCNGSMAVVQGDTSCVDTLTKRTWAVGRMLSITVGENRVVGSICDIDLPNGEFSPEGHAMLRFQVELQGELTESPVDGMPIFRKGISSYPGVGAVVHQIRAQDLAAIYAASGTLKAHIGSVSQDESIPAIVDIAEMLSKHFAILGSTGSGKSASVSLLLHAAQEFVPDLRTVILDPHDEYARAFPEANIIEQSEFDLPFWMLQLEEYVEVLFRGKPVVVEEVDILREFIPEAKVKFHGGDERISLRSRATTNSFTADTAVPYRIGDVLALIDEELGMLESNFRKPTLKTLRARIVAHCNDKRYAFMFRHSTISDIADSIVSKLFCFGNSPNSLITLVKMAGMPGEVVDAVASVLCRLSFDLAVAAQGNLKVLVVCEEAHRYIPTHKGGFEPTRRAISRIAKEGRKYGAFLAIVSQRPSELDATILSQCSTVFALRLTNDFDQDIIRGAISASSASAVKFLSSLANREAIAFGEGMSTPMRLRFRKLPDAWLPGADVDVFRNSNAIDTARKGSDLIKRWRGRDA
ncbi:MAG: DUF87 domain-containing protein [Ahrensia sp.]|nr:DUF87 domain-containing protein [Ahrensia sp.]